MKDKIVMLIIGILIGAVITAGCFLIFSKSTQSSNGADRMNGGKMDMGNMIFDGNMVGGPNGEGKGGNMVAPDSTTTDSNT